uniref:Probable threonine--tRNA ligase, cytoplasmic n=1 Tax=Haptolina ericina TaxID=156174 RepID=A0A7S3AP41_9EUKA
MGKVVEMSMDGEEPVAEVSTEWEMWDANRPLEGDCELQLIKFEDPRGKEVFWHSSAHILGEALEGLYGAKLTHGPPTDDGFFYDSFMGSESVTPDMVSALEKKAKQIADSKQDYERVVVTKDECLELFAQNPFKVALISGKIPDGSSTTVYRCGNFVDLCKGPHVPNTSRVKAFSVTKTSATQWLGKQGNDDLQRVYAVSFPDKKELAAWKHLQEEAAKRDHRKIGVEQQLLFFDELSPGSCFFLPHGCRIYNKLMEVIRQQYWLRGYSEVVTPNMYNLKLWETSGHAAKYKENMFCFPIEGQEFGLKPMNCPGHCIMFKSKKRSYRELPMRFADFGVLHRNELSGALTGLTRVRRFQQDDAHIFCMVSQIKEEVANVLDMIATVYSYFGMSFALKLSTRPESALGDVEVWDKAEALMTEALNEFKAKTGQSWTLNPGDGAFYGPKIDVQVFDALKRAHQCATVQLDFVQPQRFDLKYQSASGDGEDTFERPVMVHRAVLGSVERMIAILIEHYAGKWPFFLSPRQAIVVPVSKAYMEYAAEVQSKIHAAGYYVDTETSSRTLNKMIREAQLAQYNFILVVGEQEQKTGSVSVRTRDNEVHGERSVDALLAEFKGLCDDHK